MDTRTVRLRCAQGASATLLKVRVVAACWFMVS
jgi:hypothetical protein